MYNIKLVALPCLCTDVFDGTEEIQPDAETDNRAKWLDYKYFILRRVLFEEVQHTGDCSIIREVC